MMNAMAANLPSPYMLIPEDYHRLPAAERFRLWEDLPYSPTKLSCCLPCYCCTPCMYACSPVKERMALYFPPATATPLEKSIVRMRKQGVVALPILINGGLKDNESSVAKAITCYEEGLIGALEPIAMRHPLQMKFDNRLALVGLDQLSFDRFLDEKLKLFIGNIRNLRWANNCASCMICAGAFPFLWPLFGACHTCSLCYHGGVKNNGLWGIPIPLAICFCYGDGGFNASVKKKASALTDSWKQELESRYPDAQFDFVWTKNPGETPLDILARYREVAISRADPSDWLGYAYNESDILIMIVKCDAFPEPEDPLSWAMTPGGGGHVEPSG